MKKIFYILSLILFFEISPLLAQDSTMPQIFCSDELESLPILQNGRVKPLYVHATETIQALIGKTSFNNKSAVQAYCLLSLSAFGSKDQINLELPVSHVKLQQLLAMSDGQKTIPFNQIYSFEKELRMAWVQEKEENSYKKALGNLLSQMSLYNSVVTGEDWVLPAQLPVSGEIQTAWPSVKDFLSNNADFVNSPAAFKSAVNQLSDIYTSKFGDKHLTEVKYAKAHLPLVAMLMVLLALAFSVLSRSKWPGLVLAFATVAIETTLIILRIYISGRAPVTNMYETVLFSGYASLIISLIVGHFRNEKLFVIVGLIYNFLTMLMLNFAHGMVSPTIGPLVPVLRDNFWLSTHVTSVIMSYGAFALSWILANIALIKVRWGKNINFTLKVHNDLVYTCIKIGVVLLSGGIILGGVWADYSWGRFWGWDPKETWSLIALCIYLVILHGKYTSWISPERFIPATALAFMSIMMAWFGVNYILAAGLHSYGFSEGGAIFLGTFFISQISLVVLTLKNFTNFKNKPA